MMVQKIMPKKQKNKEASNHSGKKLVPRIQIPQVNKSKANWRGFV